jgi:putative addiction module component (TIGR02574 family)
VARPNIAGSPGEVEIESMTKQAILAEILRLPPEERIALLGEAWDSIEATSAEVPIPEWHVQELERRLATPDPQFVPWEEVRSRLRSAG